MKTFRKYYPHFVAAATALFAAVGNILVNGDAHHITLAAIIAAVSAVVAAWEKPETDSSE